VQPVREVDHQAGDVLTDPARHWPMRPRWTCDADGDDWPCPKLRRHLLATRTRSEISAVMAGYYDWAVRELDLEPRAVHERLFSWHRHAGWRPAGGPL
jgi:hypothetical protein